jgi:hypothetical protein
MPHGRMKSNDVLYQGWLVKVQDKHLKKIICLKLVVHLVIMDLWRWVLTKLSHNGLWGSKLKSSRSNNDRVKHSGLMRAWSIIIKIKWDAQIKGMSLLGFPFTGLKVFVGRPGYRIDSRTIKRGFRLGTWSHHHRELNTLHTLHLPILLLLVVSLYEVLVLVASFPTSPISSKTESKCIFYCVFELKGFTGSSLWKFSHLSTFGIFPLDNSWCFFVYSCSTFSKLFKNPKFAKNGVRMQKISRFSYECFCSFFFDKGTVGEAPMVLFSLMENIYKYKRRLKQA